MLWPSGRIPPSAEWSPAPDLDRAETVDKGHGRIEVRRLQSTASLNGHLVAWPGVQQVCRLERRRTIGDKESVETVYAITSLGRAKAAAARLLQLSRDHWGIENRLHYVRDVTCGEDAGRTAAPKAAQALAAFRNTVLTLVRRLGFRPVEGFEHFAEHRDQALRLILTGRTE